MRLGTPLVPTDQMTNPHHFVTPVGQFLRRFSLDEIPQLFNVLRGDMSLVGPRPALPSQYELIDLRRQNGIFQLRPGITGWAQVNGRDQLSLEQKVAYDKEYKDNPSFGLELKIYMMTVIKVIKREGVSH
jgi:O-antigen biosynthesis protein WbqP